MKNIGNVIVSSPNTKVEECFNKYLSLSNIDNDLPTLIIGLDNARGKITNFNILVKSYNDKKTWWTFSKIERRVDFEKDVADFKVFCIDNIVDSIDYKNIDIVNLNSYLKIKKLIKYIKGNRDKCFYIDNGKFIFLYDKGENGGRKVIYGLSLNTIAFFGISKKKVIDLIRSNSRNIEIKNFYCIPNDIRRMVDNEIPKEMVLLDFFKK